MIHKDLRVETVLSGAMCIGCAAFGLTGLFSPAFFGWKSPSPFLVKLCLAVLVSMPLVWIPGFLLNLRSTCAYKTTLPERMNVRIEVEESDDVDTPARYFAILEQRRTGSGEDRIRVRAAGWNPKTSGTTISALVFFDSRSKNPLVIEIDGKRLWSM